MKVSRIMGVALLVLQSFLVHSNQDPSVVAAFAFDADADQSAHVPSFLSSYNKRTRKLQLPSADAAHRMLEFGKSNLLFSLVL